MMRRERSGHTLQPTALAHEAFVKLAMSGASGEKDEGHFFSSVVRYMRQVLVDHARKRNASKRGGGQARFSLNTVEAQVDPSTLISLDELLTELESVDPRVARIVELSYYGSFTHSEIAGLLNVSIRTIQRDWDFARAWFYTSLLAK